MKARLGIAISAFCVAACTTAEKAGPGLDDLLADKGLSRTGNEQSCLNTGAETSVEALSERVLLFGTGSDTQWINVTPRVCRNAVDPYQVILPTDFRRLCKGGQLTSREQKSGYFSGSCTLGAFKKVRSDRPVP